MIAERALRKLVRGKGLPFTEPGKRRDWPQGTVMA